MSIVVAACGTSAAAPSVAPQSSASASSAAIIAPTPSPTPTPAVSPSASPSSSPSPTPSATPVPALALHHCAGKAGKVSSTYIATTQKFWAGYLDEGSTKNVTCVEASWTEPTVTCAAGDSKADMAIYVAIVGGDGKGTTGTHQRAEQATTEAYCDSGFPVYTAWMYAGTGTSGFHSAKFGIRSGDQIWAQVSFNGHSFTMTVANVTQSQIDSVSATVKGATRNNAQWIVQSPETGCPKKCTAGPLVSFSTVRFSGAEAVIGGGLNAVDRWARESVSMGSGSLRRATVSKAAKGAFTVTWKHN
jgi:hypothetical protein